MEGILCFKMGGLDCKNSLKHYENSLKQLALKVQGLIFGWAYYRKDFCGLRFGGLNFRRAYFFIYLFFFLGGGGRLLSEFYGISSTG